MSQLLPSVQAPAVQASILDYLSTTFALSDEEARLALVDFLSDRSNGIFKGPYLRVRLPFKAAAEGWRDSLEWYEGPPPYGHQADAFKRLSSLDLGADKPRPLPTLVTTGTGSGKTEAFLYPIIDHALRAKRQRVTGTKALILYPMNALANDQAQRLAALLAEYPELRGITAALYTGEKGPERTVVSKDGLITSRSVIRSSPPDILLTNYKMLDQLLLRPEDQKIWAESAISLQYLVLDEFHTYDGAQGTDVSMLLRRLGLALKSHWPNDGSIDEADWARPLGRVTPVATSATLGDKGDPLAMLEFARTVFGETFPESSVVTESRRSVDEWLADATTNVLPRTDREAIESVVATAGQMSDGRRIAETVLAGLFLDSTGSTPELDDHSPGQLLALVKAHPFTRALIELAGDAVPLDALAEQVIPTYATDEASRDLAEAFLLALAAALSHIRKDAGREALSVDLHLWVRELTRIERAAAGTPDYLWSDDLHLAEASSDTAEPGAPALPAVFCRHCGRSGWAAERAPIGGFDLTGSDSTSIRRARLAESQEFRVLIHAPGEAELPPVSVTDPDEPRLMWFHVGERTVASDRPDGDDEDLAAGRILPVLVHHGPKAGKLSTNDTCPSCMQKDGIRFLGSAIATLLSVSLSSIFGSDDLDKAEKKALIFTDSVQDAAHRAGFVQSRSHSLTLRAALRGAVCAEKLSLDQLVDVVMQQAGDDPHARYRLLPPDFADRKEFGEFWQKDRQSQVSAGVRRRVKRRLLLDTVLEFGLQSRLGRTLELTGTLGAEVDLSAAAMLKIAREGQKAFALEHFEGLGVTDEQLVAWVRGVLEKMRADGAIAHEWFRKYQAEDGRRYSIWGGRPRSDGMPAFPRGRGAPAYPRIGGGVGTRDSDLTPVGAVQSWYAVWTARALTCTPSEGASLAVALMNQLVTTEVVNVVNTNSGGQVFEIPQSAILVGRIGDDAYESGKNLLACEICGSTVPGTARVVDELDTAPCFVVRCSGRLQRAVGRADNFYRRLYDASEITRVVAREHTSLLDDETRLRYENQFKSSASDPQAPNVLVATPTLEMGIDIGDLSTVILASLPRSVSSYLQRVGRAGRLTGSALNLAFVSGRGEQLPRLGDPLSVINGQVRPPATYLDAEEILRRQYIASLADQIARQKDGPHPKTATQAIGSIDDGTFLSAVVLAGEDPTNLDAFLAAFDTVGDDARIRLRAWAAPAGGPATSPLSVHLHEQSHRWAHQVSLLKHRIQEIQTSLPELQERRDLPAATEDDKVAYRTAVAALKLARAQLDDLAGPHAYWIGVLEEYGLLPNYTLLDDSVTLDVTLSWIDPDTQEYMSEPATFNRGAALALREFAPGATFYARGHKIQIDAVDLGAEAESIKRHAFCPSCGFSTEPLEPAQPPPPTCPRCGDPAIADVKQVLEVVELERVSSAMRREEASIDDGRDERERTPFQVITAADVGEPKRQWYLDGYQFGVKHVPRMKVRWVNLGRASDQGAGARMLSGEEYAAPLFRVCSACGKLDSRTGANTAAEHRPWCSYRNSTTESVRSIALSRTLITEGVVIQLPAVLSYGDRFAVPSLMAALQLGLREHLGGAPDHLAMEQIVDPFLSDGTENRDALLLHDTVPGGTGYLAELADPEKFYAVLYKAWTAVRDCPCKDEGRAACHRCLTPFINASTQRYVARVNAEQSLRSILMAGKEGEPPDAASWVVTQEQSAAYEPETHIEQNFRKVLRDRLTNGLGVSVLEQPTAQGTRWTINATGGRSWSMDPQMLLGGVQPDFVFSANDPNIPRLAVFCDGWQFHANPAINNVAADAQKRASLRAQGFVVLGITWQDLLEAEQQSSTAPPWFSEGRWTQVLQAANGALKPGHRDLVKGGPIDFIVSWISKPDPDGVRALAESLPFLLYGSGTTGKVDSKESLVAVAKELYDGTPLPTAGDRSAWSWQNDTVTFLARNVLPNGTATEVAVVLDDRTASLGPQRKSAWRDWTRLSNLLNLRLQDAHITAYTLTQAATTQGEDLLGPELAEPWASLYRDAVGAERSLILDLAGAGLVAPTLGHETVNGLPIDIAWPDFRIAVDLALDEPDREELIAEGWRLVEADIAAIGDALVAAGER